MVVFTTYAVVVVMRTLVHAGDGVAFSHPPLRTFQFDLSSR